MNRKFPILLALLIALPGAAAAEIALSVSAGSTTMVDDGIRTPELDVAATLWYPFDQMVFLGITSGVQNHRSEQQVPALGSLYLRLPIGRQLMPVATGDWGYLFGERSDTWIWRAGGGLDLKLGNHSSLLALAGVQSDLSDRLPNRLYFRAGLLLEW